jgi:hypothetical protein
VPSTSPVARGGAAAPVRDVIRVASIPASHVYVRHLSDPDGPDGVIRLRDPEPGDGRKVPGGWWPPVALDPEWIVDHAGEFDVFHVHFGFDAKTPADLAAVGAALRGIGVPLVVTVHDLRNPHHDDADLHAAQLGTLLADAAEVITLTPGAAEVIGARWGPRATVLPHPHVVDPDTMVRPRPAREGFVVGLHAKSVRANMEVERVAGARARTVAELPGARVRIDLHDEVSDPGSHWYAPAVRERLRGLARRPQVELHEHAYFTDDELWGYLLGLDVSVLPYAFGTHSGWLEACHDLGTAVVAPTCGFYAEQRPCLTYGHDTDALDADSLARAIRTAYLQRPAPRADPRTRRRERRDLARAHRTLYERALR